MSEDEDVDQTAGAALRWARATVLALVSLTLGAGAHVGAEGTLPAPVWLLAVLAASGAVAAGLLGRPATRGRVVLLLVAGQLLTHTALGLLAGHATAVTGHSGHAGHTTHAGHAIATVDATRAADAADYGSAAVMALAHLLAAVVVGLYLAAGEDALWRLLGLAGDGAQRLLDGERLVAAAGPVAAALLAALTAVLELGRASRRAALRRRPRPPRLRVPVPVLSRRGPPMLSSARG